MGHTLVASNRHHYLRWILVLVQFNIFNDVLEALRVNIVKFDAVIFRTFGQGFGFGGEAGEEVLGYFELFMI